MKNLQLPLALLAICLLASFAPQLQSPAIPQGVATYEVFTKKGKSRTMHENIKELKRQIQDPLLLQGAIDAVKKHFKPSSYRLAFKGDQSIYYRDMSEAPAGVKNTVKFRRIYKNVDSQVLTENAYIFTKRFLIEEKLPSINWALQDSSRDILPFKAKLATATIDGREVSAWYTPDVPTSTGPAEFWGLKGLILEVHVENSRSIFLKSYSTVFTDEDNEQLQKPTKGKKIDRESFKKEKQRKLNEFTPR